MVMEVTDEQVKHMAAAAINASKAVGMGWLHHDPTMNITPDDIHIVDNYLSIDYFQGRMVKFHARKTEDGKWKFHPDDLSPAYQSWCLKYTSWEMLLEASKIK